MGISYQLEGRSQEARGRVRPRPRDQPYPGGPRRRGDGAEHLSALYSVDGDFEAAERTAKESISLARKSARSRSSRRGKPPWPRSILRQGNDGEARRWIREAPRRCGPSGVRPSPWSFCTLLELRTGDRSKGLSRIGSARAHDPNQRETRGIIDSFRESSTGSDLEEAVETGLRAGEGLTLEGIPREAERARV